MILLIKSNIHQPKDYDIVSCCLSRSSGFVEWLMNTSLVIGLASVDNENTCYTKTARSEVQFNKMRTLVITGVVLLSLITAAESAIPPGTFGDGRDLLKRETVRPKGVVERTASSSKNRPIGKDPPKKNLKKSQHYVGISKIS